MSETTADAATVDEDEHLSADTDDDEQQNENANNEDEANEEENDEGLSDVGNLLLASVLMNLFRNRMGAAAQPNNNNAAQQDGSEQADEDVDDEDEDGAQAGNEEQIHIVGPFFQDSNGNLQGFDGPLGIQQPFSQQQQPAASAASSDNNATPFAAASSSSFASMFQAFQPPSNNANPFFIRQGASYPPVANNAASAAVGGAQPHAGRRRRPRQRAFCSSSTAWSSPCEHTTRVYERPGAVPIEVCTRCDSIVSPDATASQSSVVATAVPLPHSMRRDDRWAQLLQMHGEHARSLESIERMLRDQERMLLKLHEWRDLFSAGAVDYAAQHNPMYVEIERSIKKLVNMTSGFQQTIITMLDEHRTKLIREIRRAVPQTQTQFINSAKRAILRAKPNAMLYPTAGSVCSVCQEKPVNVRLHQAVQRVEQAVSSSHSAALSWITGGRSGSAGGSGRNQKLVQPCTCHTFSTCVDCLLTWYWEQSEGLQKSFATCPACRAEFVLEDIVPVFSAAGASSSTACNPSAAAATTAT